MKRRSFLSILLVFCMIMQMLAPAWARPVEGTTTSESSSSRSSDVSKAQEEFQKSYDTIMALEEVDLGKMASVCVGGVSFFENIGVGAHNLWDKWTNGGNDQQEYKDYIKQIEDANEKIRQAKKDAEAMKKQYDAGKIDDAKKADVNKIAEKGFVAQTQAVDTLRDTLTTAGTTLEKVGKVCSEIGTVLGIVNAVLKVVSIAFAPSAPFIAPILVVTEPAATALGIAGPLIEAAGTSLVESAQAGQFADQQLLKNMAVDVAIEGGKQVATELITKGVTNGLTKGAGKLAEDLGKKYGDDVAKKLVGTCSGAWDPAGIYKSAVTSDLTEVLGEKFLEDEAQEALADMVDQTVDYALDKAGVDVPSVSGFVEDKIEEGVDYLGDKAKDALKKSVNDNAGLHTGSSGVQHGGGGGRGF
ncbi:MAG: hypothetical protein II567_15710 [Candidatus Riflebacteria bacterium]|nr:hypothetical protein [Candidatus Riflebacteria bacterium]